MKFIIHDLLKAFPGKSNVGALGLSNAELIITDKMKILFDTGSHGVKTTLMKSLESLAVYPDEIDAIFISHLHYDHCENVTMFPKAKLIINKVEWDYAMEQCDVYTPLENLQYMKTRAITFVNKDNQEVFDGMRAIYTPGHTLGHMSLLLDTNEGNWVLAADACKNRGELKLEKSDQFVSEHDSISSIRKIKSISRRVLPGHDCWLTIENGEVIPEQSVIMDIMVAQGICLGNNSLFRLQL